MGRGDLSSDLGFGILDPASAVRPVESNANREESGGKSRRRPQAAEESQEEDSAATEPGDKPRHEVDRLA
jgi:hypothetical protein